MTAGQDAGGLIAILREHWHWALPNPMRVIAINAFGNLLVELGDHSVWRVCPEDLEAKRVAESVAQLTTSMTDEDFALDWTAAAWCEAAVAALGPLGPGQCYGFRVWPVLGADYSADNMVIKNLADWLAASGHVGQQVKDLP